jgi:hypothetical protein
MAHAVVEPLFGAIKDVIVRTALSDERVAREQQAPSGRT